jgi:hypothetical protein
VFRKRGDNQCLFASFQQESLSQELTGVWRARTSEGEAGWAILCIQVSVACTRGVVDFHQFTMGF